MKFSIITCTLNSAKYLNKNINSVKNQNFDDWEHIFIDGGSKDKTLEILKKYHQKIPQKVRMFQFPARGIANAMNKGIKKARGEYLIHLHSDDSLHNKNVLGSVAEFIKKNHNPDWIYGKANFINIETKKKIIFPFRKIYHKPRFWLLLLTNYIPHQAVFLKKEVFEKYGLFDESLKNCMDYKYWLILSKNKVQSAFINKIICDFSVRPDSQSTVGVAKEENLIIIDEMVKNNLLRVILKGIHIINAKRKLI